MTTTYRTREADMLDAICYRHYGTHVGVVERVLAVSANRHLADVGPVLPAGLTIELPELEQPAPPAYVRLWS